MTRRDDIVSASEIAAWAWCPESWRLRPSGAEPGNRADLVRGATHHAETVAFELQLRAALSLGLSLLVLGLLIALVAYLLMGVR